VTRGVHRPLTRRAAVASLLASTLLATSANAESSAAPDAPPVLSHDQSFELDLERQAHDDAGGSDHRGPLTSKAPSPSVHRTPAAGTGNADEVPVAPRDLPSGGASVSPQAVALPSGPSSVTGMGESFTTQLSTGIVGLSVPLKLLTARGGVQPRLDVAYSSGAGFGLAGKGWSIGSSAISRQTDRGVPQYLDQGDWHPEQDRFVFGGMELVPICTVGSTSATTCAGKLQAGEVLPAWANGWQYFRPRVEGAFLRFFWSLDRRTWRVQSKDGSNIELGVPLDGSGYTGALERNPEDPTQIFRWYIARQYDGEGDVQTTTPQPVNSIIYRYQRDGEAVYLSDIFDTSPAASPTSPNVSLHAHHTRVVYESRPDVARSFRSGWLVEHRLRVARVDVTSKPFSGSTSAARELVRRYHFEYEANFHTSLLASVQMEGRCAIAVEEQSDQSLPLSSCPRLPALRFEYQRVTGSANRLRDSSGNAFEAFNEKLVAVKDSPPHSLDDALTGMMDVNADGLSDVVVTAPGLFDGKHAVYFNGVTADGSPGFAKRNLITVQQLGGVDADVLRFDNTNVAPLDLDADGLVNLVHMPKEKSYSVFSPVKLGSNWTWQGRAVATASKQDIKIDFTANARDTKVMDVNGDGLVDVVYSSPTELQTFFALGRFPGGDGQFGQAEWSSASSAEIKNDPVTKCAPWSGQTVRFSDPDVRIADLNGDGFADIARVRSGQILYWPGRGTGYWGTGARQGCAAGELAQNRHIEMLSAPQFSVTRPGALQMADVNGDGLSDMVEIRSQGVDIYLNDNGTGWTERHVIEGTPFLPSTGNFASLTDIDGSGTPDILWGRADEYKYIDLTGGVSPHLLIRTHNGLGGTTELEYASTTDVMRKAAVAGNPWSSFTPTVSPVLVRSTARDHLEAVGRPAGIYVTEYSYRDPVYEGRQREFRGFREATTKKLGDATGPTVNQRSVFQLGECSDDFQNSSADVCSPSLRWQDNWREPLKGLPAIAESFDANGVYLSTEHTKYELRQLYTGLDGRRVSVAYRTGKDLFLYDTANAASFTATTILELDEVVANLQDITHTEKRAVVRRANSGTAHIRSSTQYDAFGHAKKTIREGCVEGCSVVDESIIAEGVFVLPPGDASGWLWRESTSFTVGSISTARRNEVLHTYDAKGKLVRTDAVLSGSLALDRFHVDNNTVPPTIVTTPPTVAPPPPDASGGISSPVQILVVENAYNDFGQLISTRGPNNRCGSGTFDALYSQLSITASSHVGPAGGDCGATILIHIVPTYDRGLEVPIDSVDPTGQSSQFSYDGFGRVVSARFTDPATGTLAANPSFAVEYHLPQDPTATPYSITINRTLDGASFGDSSYKENWSFTDALGRTIATLAEADAEDAGDWIVGGAVEYNTKGEVVRTQDPWYYTGAPANFQLGNAPDPGTTCAPRGAVASENDAFGRPVRKYGRDQTLEVSVYHHAVSQDVHDAADSASGPQQGTHVTTLSDGHGRGIRRTQRIHASGGGIEEHYVVNDYLPTGEVYRVIQRRTGSLDVVRWLRHDSLGRVVLNAEPNTSPNFNADPATPAENIKAWRYAYNDAGDMVGTSDARGCGANYHYDTGGRLIAEDRSPCLATTPAGQGHAAWSEPNLVTGDGTEAFYVYDAADPESGSIADRNGQAFTVDSTYLAGRLASVSGLGTKTVFRYDALGRLTGAAARVVKPGVPASVLANRYAPAWYTKTRVVDVLARPVTASTGLPGNVTQLLGAGGASELAFTYAKTGRVKSVGGSYGTLFAGGVYHPDGRADSLTLGDEAQTTRTFCYDVKKRVSSVQTMRAEPGIWTSPPAGSPYTPPVPADFTTQLALEHYDFTYDLVGNISQIQDFRVPADWPNTAKPVTRSFEYDDLYRLKRATYQKVGGGADPWTSPYEAENTNSNKLPKPNPHASFSNRIQEQTFEYDWLGNPSAAEDDSRGFYDRSLGAITSGTATEGPNQIRSASNFNPAPPQHTYRGSATTQYDAAGNLIRLNVSRHGPCLPSGALCSHRYAYEWDEIGQLVRARRWDMTTSQVGPASDPLPTALPNAELAYAYDVGSNRVLKTATTPSATPPPAPAYTVSIFPSLELRRTTWSGTEYAFDSTVIHLLVPAGLATARIFYATESMPMLTSGQQHVFFNLPDHLGSTSFLIDKATGELVEFGTYQAYGAAESNFRPSRWAAFREPLSFSGKEEDIEVGLAYFGARYYSPYLLTWLSPDRVTIHELGSDMNPYAYVRGSPLMGIDPDGNDLITAIAVGAAIGAAILGGSAYIAQASAEGTFDFTQWQTDGAGWKILGAAMVGAVAGGISGGLYFTNVSAVLSALGSPAVSAPATAGGAEGTFLISTGGVSLLDATVIGTGAGTSVGAFGGGIYGAFKGEGAQGVLDYSLRGAEAGAMAGLGAGLGAWAGGGYPIIGGKFFAWTFGISGGVNGALSGWRQTYAIDELSGYHAFAADSSWGAAGTLLGNGVNIYNTARGDAQYSEDLSWRENRHVFLEGFYIKDSAAHTQGNVTSNLNRDEGAHRPDLVDHEREHIWTNRLFGPAYIYSYGGWLVVGGVSGLAVGAGLNAMGYETDVGGVVEGWAYYSNPWEQVAYWRHNPRAWSQNAPPWAFNWFGM
jgi:RHS repeat-associated protein